MTARFRVTVAPEAVVDVVQISAWWRKNRPRAPELFVTELDDALLLLAEHPELGARVRSKRVANARVVELSRSRYRVFYQVVTRTGEILVLHVRHASRRPLAGVQRPRARR
jgi:plasmid stabilization system protein ParE